MLIDVVLLSGVVPVDGACMLMAVLVCLVVSVGLAELVKVGEGLIVRVALGVEVVVTVGEGVFVVVGDGVSVSVSSIGTCPLLVFPLTCWNPVLAYAGFVYQ
jgi:hypothetical protein